MNTLELRGATAPYFRQREPIKSLVLSRLAAALALLIPALFVHGFRAVMLAGGGVLGAVVVEGLWRLFEGKPQTLGDLSAVTTGVLCALLLPAGVPVWLPAVAAAFAVGVIKLPFGGLGRSPFSPEAGGACFAALIAGDLALHYNSALLEPTERAVLDALPKHCFAYADGALPLFGSISYRPWVSDMLSTQTLLRTGGDPRMNLVELLFSGSRNVMGQAAPFLLLLCAGWLLLRRVFAWQAAASYAAVLVVLSLLASWPGVSFLEMPGYELLTGSALLCAVFLVGDIHTAPHTGTGRLLYGGICALATVIFRRVGQTEGGEVFAVLMANAVASPIDRLVWSCNCRGFSLAAYRRLLVAKLRKRFGSKGRFDIDIDELYAELERDNKLTGGRNDPNSRWNTPHR